jgi:hypothetical protein
MRSGPDPLAPSGVAGLVGAWLRTKSNSASGAGREAADRNPARLAEDRHPSLCPASRAAERAHAQLKS